MNILVTGMSGVGKSSLCTHLKQQGYDAFDMDEIKNLCKLYHPDGTLVTVDESRLELNMLEVDFLCDPDLLQEHIKNKTSLTLYFGYMDNFSEVVKYFDQIFLLTLPSKENRYRMSTRTTTDFAKHEKTQDEILSFKDAYENLVLEHGAIKIDASNEISMVAKRLLEKITDQQS